MDSHCGLFVKQQEVMFRLTTGLHLSVQGAHKLQAICCTEVGHSCMIGDDTSFYASHWPNTMTKTLCSALTVCHLFRG